MKFNSSMKTFLISILLMGVYYSLIFSNLIQKNPMEEFPILRDRLGTIMWHSSGTDKNTHLYCYYPSSSEDYKNKGGEYIIKRAKSIEDCNNWMGMAVFNEPKWVSEREKIWWNKEMLIQENLAKQETSPDLN